MKCKFILFSFFILHFVKAQIPSNGLVAAYLFNGNTFDNSPYQNNGVNTISYASDRKSNPNACMYDNGLSYVFVPAAPQLNLNNSFTISAWINPSTNSIANSLTQAIFEKSNTSISNKLSYGMYYGSTPTDSLTNRVYFKFLTNTSGQIIQLNSSQRLKISNWYHVVLSYSNQNMVLYINGVKDTAINYNLNIPYVSEALYIGSNAATTLFFKGFIDDIYIYKREMLSCEVLNFYQGTLAKSPYVKAGIFINNTKQCFKSNIYNFIDTNITSSAIKWRLLNWGIGVTDTISAGSLRSNSFANPGIYKLSFTIIDTGGCYDSAYQNLTVDTPVYMGFKVNKSQQCFTGNAFVITDSSKYVNNILKRYWEFGDGGTDSTLTMPKFYSYLMPGSYAVTSYSIDKNGCRDTFNKTLIVSAKPIPLFTITTKNYCQGSTISFIDSSSQISGNSNYQWLSDNVFFSNLRNVTKQYNESGKHAIKLIINNQGCSDSLSKNFTILRVPNAKFALTNTSFCQSKNIFTLNDTFSYGNDFLQSRIWYLNGQVTDTVKSFNYHFSTINSHTVFLQLTLQNGCSDTFSRSVTILPSPKVNFSLSDSSICVGQSVSIANKTSIESGTFQSTFNLGDGYNTPLDSFSYKYINSGIYVLTLISKGNQNCYDTLRKIIQVKPTVKNGFSSKKSYCMSDKQMIFSDTSSYSGAYSRLWVCGDKIETQREFVIPIKDSGTYTVSLYHVNDVACKDTLVKNIIVYSNPNSKPSWVSNSICINDNQFIFTDSVKTTEPLQLSFWSFGDGSVSFAPTITHHYITTDSFNVMHLIQSAQGCTDTAKFSINIKPKPQIKLYTPILQNCQFKGSFEFSDTSHHDRLQTIYWKNDTNIQSGFHVNYIDNRVGTHQVYAIPKTLDGCMDTIKINYLVKLNSIPTINYKDSFICKGTKYLFTNTNNDTIATVSYRWYVNDNLFDSSKFIQYFVPNDSLIQIKFIRTLSNGCENEFKKVLSIKNRPKADFSINIIKQCLMNNNVIVNDQSSYFDNKNALQWNFNNEYQSNDSQAFYSFKRAGTYRIYLTVINNYSCIDSISKLIYIDDKPKTSMIQGDSIQFLGLQSTYQVDKHSGSSYQWIFGNGEGSSISDRINIRWTTIGSTKISVIETSNNNCIGDTISKIIHIEGFGGITDKLTGHTDLWYPKPAQAIIYNNEDENPWVELHLMDMHGKTISTIKNRAGIHVLDISEMNEGMYVIHGIHANGINDYEYIIKQ